MTPASNMMGPPPRASTPPRVALVCAANTMWMYQSAGRTEDTKNSLHLQLVPATQQNTPCQHSTDPHQYTCSCTIKFGQPVQRCWSQGQHDVAVSQVQAWGRT